MAAMSRDNANLEAWTPPQNSVDPGLEAWPPSCTLAELGRILAMTHGPHAPSESLLKKWSASGVFQDCLVGPAPEGSDPAASLTQQTLLRPRRAGRPGLRLNTQQALQRVRDQWPQLAHFDTQAVFELAVARTADRLQTAATAWSPSGRSEGDALALPLGAAMLEKIEIQLSALQEEVVAVKRELAQFSALRNNLITKLDEAVARAQEALSGRGSGTGADPLVEARRDRDMGVLKSMMSDILDALERIEGSGRALPDQ